MSWLIVSENQWYDFHMHMMTHPWKIPQVFRSLTARSRDNNMKPYWFLCGEPKQLISKIRCFTALHSTFMHWSSILNWAITRRNFEGISYDFRLGIKTIGDTMMPKFRYCVCMGPTLQELTQFLLDKMAGISQMIFSDAFSLMKTTVFWLKFHLNLFLRVQLTITHHWFR